ncbi:MAG: mandelate racemase/muconate lactonizing enzyme family protein [Acidobacteriia bacterium]|nr:mandelate racemase/muconate lactonizing enzyme family protein [Terriglobia bacterium]
MISRRQLLAAAPLPFLAPFRALAHGPLKIAAVEPFVLKIGPRRDIVAVRIRTEDGVHGWGEGTTPPTVRPVLTQIETFRKGLIGASAWDTEKLWRDMYTVEENTLGGTLYAAMSAIDIALWDIVGKKLGVPVYQLLGGKVHTRLRIYTSYRWGNIPRTRDAYFQKTKDLMEQGATAGKFDPFGEYPGPDRQLSTLVLNEVREMVRGIREAGPNFDICIEAHGKFNVASAGRIIKMLEPFDPFFLEEPVPPENADAMAALQRSTNIPIATGEGLQSHFNYREILHKQAARILQPDVARTGGITAMKKIAAMADAHYVTIAPHNPNGPICTAASIHLAASIPNFTIMEEGNRNVEQYNDIFVGGWKPRLDYWDIPDKPGLGVDIPPALLKSIALPA